MPLPCFPTPAPLHSHPYSLAYLLYLFYLISPLVAMMTAIAQL